jgi:hypothetical protein
MNDAGGFFWRWLKVWAAQLAARSRSGAGGLSIAARLDLGGKKSLLAVEYQGRCFLLATGVETISAPVEVGVGRGAGRVGERQPASLSPKAQRAAQRRLRRLRAAGDGAGVRVEPAARAGRISR